MHIKIEDSEDPRAQGRAKVSEAAYRDTINFPRSLHRLTPGRYPEAFRSRPHNQWEGTREKERGETIDGHDPGHA